MKRLPLVVPLMLAAMLVTMSACGGDSTGPETPKVDGSWSLSLTNMSGSGISCSWSGMTASLTQSGTTFSGSYSGGTYTCTGGGESISGNVGSGSVIDGSINGNEVRFAIDTPDMPMTGTISGQSMSGTGTLRYDLGSPYGVITLSGSWGAARK